MMATGTRVVIELFCVIVYIHSSSESKCEVFALKAIDRTRFKSRKHEKMVLNEKNVQLALNNPFHLRLINTYKTPTKLYVLTEYMQGGDMFDLIDRCVANITLQY